MLSTLAQILFAALAGVLVYHHIGYPVLLRLLARRARASGVQAPVAPLDRSDADLPTITLIVPAHNEAMVMVSKLTNLEALDYPRDRLKIVLALDGCTDDTRAIVQSRLPRLEERLQIEVVEYVENIGKIAVINAQIGAATSTLVALSDTSAAIAPDALLRAAAHFRDQNVGVVCGSYRLREAGSEGERAYWAYQTAIKADEAAVAAPMGAHGAFYLFRRAAWTPLAADTINDDFILPMRIVAQGYRALYDAAIMATELERTRATQEFHRRIRIGAGNLQQVLALPGLADPRRGALAFVFLSGKGLRPFIPALAIVAAVLLAGLAIAMPGPLYKVLFVLAAACGGAAGYALLHRDQPMPGVVRWLAYLVEGHAASGLGAWKYLRGQPLSWRARAVVTSETGEPWSYLKPEVSIGKRIFDIIVGTGALVVFALLFIPIALAIRLESRGPILYRQRRVGLVTPDRAETFELLKFRSMYVDAEQRSGAVWATKDDPRVTRVGRFLRKSRLDELPQCLNVLAGDMSIVGPRPERPGFFNKLEAAVPFYVERTFGIRPGITGLAQVNLPYDASIDDVRMKCVYDHAYATRLTSLSGWLKADLGIFAKTLTVMVMGKGQ
jgi:lipopolysaccharide/colanic/teichoic acid biosynthesis glycosyltransferase/cellulose synthase/poly-beta-1,6-N-acetylglucosamine synthase-like glycosyltransferase